ncbi:MAG TPA: peptidoglycan bridge formation glycyltransferase FemA/FemB family protein [Elusimicrobiales bacterium]|nr:peptidoglycan bridge formation glycyltransferase FemA/FemB family protein [Elusimicrobiales bacterium]
MLIRNLTPEDKPAWEALVQRTPESGFMQSWDWSEFKAAQGQCVTRLGIFEGDELAGGTLVYSVESGLAPLQLPHGPVLPWKQPLKAAQCLELLRTRLAEIAARTGAPLARLEPCLEGELPGWLEKMPRAPLDLVPTPTLLVELSCSDEKLLGAMQPKGRYNVRLAVRKGVEVVSAADAESLNDFYGLFELTCARHGFNGEPPSFFEALLRTLGPAGGARLYFAGYKGMLLSAAIAVFYGDKATYLYGASAPFMRSAMAPYAMHWQIMRDARARGCRVYDMYGIAPEGQPLHAYSRFTPFKLRFGGRRALTCGGRDLYFYPQLARLLLAALSDKGVCNV